MDAIELIEQLGQWANNNDFMNGLLMIGAATMTLLFGAYRLVMGRRKDTSRIKVNMDAPAGTKIRFESGEEEADV